MSKHTPGPWEVVDSFYPSMKEVAGPSFNVKAVIWATDLTERDYQERLADLRLIAAAPDLLALLQRFVNRDPYNNELTRAARAAIAQATGGQP